VRVSLAPLISHSHLRRRPRTRLRSFPLVITSAARRTAVSMRLRSASARRRYIWRPSHEGQDRY
jgi:hypothetical protein